MSQHVDIAATVKHGEGISVLENLSAVIGE